mmetsp:Transcript_20493/g.43311  ORF Transcript_20493/g.43311 Transcript_20493/m.43311 type:complete len:250 (-) Transcript_20493:374-1123(-)
MLRTGSNRVWRPRGASLALQARPSTARGNLSMMASDVSTREYSGRSRNAARRPRKVPSTIVNASIGDSSACTRLARARARPDSCALPLSLDSSFLLAVCAATAPSSMPNACGSRGDDGRLCGRRCGSSAARRSSSPLSPTASSSVSSAVKLASPTRTRAVSLHSPSTTTSTSSPVAPDETSPQPSTGVSTSLRNRTVSPTRGSSSAAATRSISDSSPFHPACLGKSTTQRSPSKSTSLPTESAVASPHS